MKDKSKRLEQMKASCIYDKEAMAAWGRAQKNIKAAKVASGERFKKN